MLAVRAAWGTVLLSVPDRVLALSRSDHPHDRTARRVLRVLGARHLAQTAVEMISHRPALRYLGVGVDGLHAASGAALAALDSRWRRAAWLDAGIATGFAVAGLLTARTTGSGAPAHG